MGTGIGFDMAATLSTMAGEMGMATSSNWFVWVLLSAVFAAMTAIFAKIGLAGVDSDLATLIRTVVIFGVLAAFVYATGKWANPFELSGKTWLFLVLSGLATGASWVCYFRALKVGDAAKVAPVDKLSLLLVAVFAVVFLHERPSLREWTGIAMVGAGVLVLAIKR
jgi:transporter family protein